MGAYYVNNLNINPTSGYIDVPATNTTTECFMVGKGSVIVFRTTLMDVNATYNFNL